MSGSQIAIHVQSECERVWPCEIK